MKNARIFSVKCFPFVGFHKYEYDEKGTALSRSLHCFRRKTRQADMIRLAGGVNVAAEIEDTYWVEIDYEQLLAWNPDYIILASNAAYTVEDVLSDPNLAGCTAVAHGNVYRLPAAAEAWDSPVPGSILGALWLSNVLHPELLTDTDCSAMIDDYYETFYNFSYSEIEK